MSAPLPELSVPDAGTPAPRHAATAAAPQASMEPDWIVHEPESMDSFTPRPLRHPQRAASSEPEEGVSWLSVFMLIWFGSIGLTASLYFFLTWLSRVFL